MAFKYSADYYDPSQPTEEEDANKEQGEKLLVIDMCGADLNDEAKKSEKKHILHLTKELTMQKTSIQSKVEECEKVYFVQSLWH